MTAILFESPRKIQLSEMGIRWVPWQRAAQALELYVDLAEAEGLLKRMLAVGR